MCKEEIIDYLIDESEGEYTREELEEMSKLQLLDAYLTWEGIVGFTEDIIEHIEAIYEVNLED